MPIYVYQCKNCGEGFERLQSFNDEPIRVCPNCGGETRRVFQPVGVIFKGSGWYKTDSRKQPSSESRASSPAKTEPAKAEGEPSKAEPTKAESATAEKAPPHESLMAKESKT